MINIPLPIWLVFSILCFGLGAIGYFIGVFKTKYKQIGRLKQVQKIVEMYTTDRVKK